jgi:hypothetical protein
MEFISSTFFERRTNPLDMAQVFSVRLRSGVTLVGQITLPRQFPGGGDPVGSLEQVDKLLSVKCPPAFLRIETMQDGQRIPCVVGTSAIEAIAPDNGSEYTRETMTDRQTVVLV